MPAHIEDLNHSVTAIGAAAKGAEPAWHLDAPFTARVFGGRAGWQFTGQLFVQMWEPIEHRFNKGRIKGLLATTLGPSVVAIHVLDVDQETELAELFLFALARE